MRNPFRYFNSSPELIRLTVLLDVRRPLSPRQVEDLLFERGIDICHETVRFWWNRCGLMFAAEIRKRHICFPIILELASGIGQRAEVRTRKLLKTVPGSGREHESSDRWQGCGHHDVGVGLRSRVPLGKPAWVRAPPR